MMSSNERLHSVMSELMAEAKLAARYEDEEPVSDDEAIDWMESVIRDAIRRSMK